MYSNQVLVKMLLQYIRKIGQINNQLQKHKIGLSKLVGKMEDFIECFKGIDLDKKGIIYPKILQTYLMYVSPNLRSNKYYHNPTSISRYYNKYSHQKKYLAYQDILESLLPSADFMLFSSTITQQTKQSKYIHSCQQQKIKVINYLTAFIISQQLKLFNQDYLMMKNITKGSQSIGATLWRLLDKNHNNELNFQKISEWADELGIVLSKKQWQSFLYWQFHSYKQSMCRYHFMKIVNIYEQRKRASSACRIDQFKLQTMLFQKAAEDKARNQRILSAVRDKIAIVSEITKNQYLNIVGEEHFEYSLLNSKRLLSGKKGYSNPKKLIKYTVQKTNDL